MLHIGFIFPSSHYLHDPFRGDPHTHFQILTVLEEHFQEKVKLSLIDLRGIEREYAIQHVPECDLYLHSVYTLDSDEEEEIVRSIKKHYPKAQHIAGGPHVAVFPEESLKVYDSLILGFGEHSMIQAVKDFEAQKLQKTYRQGQNVDINVFPFPRRHYLPKPAVIRTGLVALKKKPEYDALIGTTAIFSRGCTNNCAFCSMPALNSYSKQIKYRRPDLIEEEIEYLKREYGVQCLNFLDEIGIPPYREMALPYLEAIGRTGIAWRGQCRVGGVTPETARLARQSGCVCMGMGLESVSQASLDLVNKQITLDQARETIRLLKENDIQVRLYLISGLPAEPEDIVEKTWEFIQETKPEQVTLSLFTIRPGTELYLNPKKFGLKNLSSDWSKTMHMYGRYKSEDPFLTFEYENPAPWGRSIAPAQILKNHSELLRRIKQAGLG